MTPNLSNLQYDIPAAAGWFSSIAGVLAGFALLSILIPLDHEAKKESESRSVEAVIAFTCAFFSLLILAFSYAVLSGRIGDGPVQGVATYEQLLNGSALGLSTLLLLFGLHAILLSYGSNRIVFRPARGLITRVTRTLGPIIILSFQFSSSLDVEAYRARTLGQNYASASWLGLPVGILINLVIILSAIFILIVLSLLHKSLPQRPGIQCLVGELVLFYTVFVAVFCSLILPLLPERVLVMAGLEHGLVAITAFAVIAVAIAGMMDRGSPEDLPATS